MKNKTTTNGGRTSVRPTRSTPASVSKAATVAARNNTPARVSIKLSLEREVTAAFRALCKKDSIGMIAGVETMMRWAAQNGTLFPVMKAEQSLAGPLKSIHRQLTNALRTVRIAASHCD